LKIISAASLELAYLKIPMSVQSVKLDNVCGADGACLKFSSDGFFF